MASDEPEASPSRRLIDLPPVWLAAFMILGWALSEHAPDWRFQSQTTIALGAALIAAGVALAVWSAVFFWRARTSIIPGREADRLITQGPYRFSRNPIYLADLLVLVGLGFALGSIWPFALAPVFVWVLERRFIAPEEVMLRRRFPQAFADWSSSVRRWI